jgi:hypothetical protein
VTDDPFEPLPDSDADDVSAAAGRPVRLQRDPTVTLNLAMLVYIFVTLVFALPLVILPETFFDAIGLPERAAQDLGGLRWMGSMLLAWAISGILVLARPGGRAIFVTTGALQFTFGALSLLYSWSIGEFEWDTWFQLFATALLIGGSIVLWWARFSARKVLGDRSRAGSDV